MKQQRRGPPPDHKRPPPPPAPPKARTELTPLAGEDEYESHSPQVDKILPALLLAQTEFKKPDVSGQDGHYRRSYSTLGDMLEATMTALHNHDLVLYQSPVPTPCGMSVRTVLVHTSGQFLRSEIPLANASSAIGQSRGAEITYARRQSIDALLALGGLDDDSGPVASKVAALARSKRGQQDPIEHQQLDDLYALGVQRGAWEDGAGFSAYCAAEFGHTPTAMTQQEFQRLHASLKGH